MTPTEVGYYQINGTKKVLYWDGNEWKKPEKDSSRKYGTFISTMDKQPKNVKVINEVRPEQIGYL